MDDKFKTWMVMSMIMMGLIVIMTLILKIKEFFQLIRFRKIYNIAIKDGTFKIKYPDMCGIWGIDKKYFFLLKEKKRRAEIELENNIYKEIIKPEAKEEI